MRGADGSGQAKDRSSRYTIDRQPALADAQTVLEQSLSFSGSSEDTALLDEVLKTREGAKARAARDDEDLLGWWRACGRIGPKLGSEAKQEEEKA